MARGHNNINGVTIGIEKAREAEVLAKLGWILTDESMTVNP